MGRVVGIEKMNVYPTQLKLDLALLAEKRGYDVEHLHSELLLKERSLNPPWEDSVTMAVNAALPVINEENKNSIGLLVVGTETSVDQEKSISSWVHRFLNLPSNCRHFEIKGACYSGTAGLKVATSWLRTDAKKGQKALVITCDQSLHSINKPWEFVGGAAGVAVLVSHKPDLLLVENEKFGIYAHEVSDVIRPLPWIETGNSDDSLFSYVEGLHYAYEDYVANVGNITFDEYFTYNVYHVPFAGISYRAHKQLLNSQCSYNKKQVRASFTQKTQPSIVYPQKIGSAYGGSVFIALSSLLRYAEDIQSGNRVGVFAYGSGSCAEFFSCIVGEHGKCLIEQTELDKRLQERFAVNVEEYEHVENVRMRMVQDSDFSPDFECIGDVFNEKYVNKGLLIYTGAKGYYRNYEFS